MPLTRVPVASVSDGLPMVSVKALADGLEDSEFTGRATNRWLAPASAMPLTGARQTRGKRFQCLILVRSLTLNV